jgi:hypothetical protein
MFTGFFVFRLSKKSEKSNQRVEQFVAAYMEPYSELELYAILRNNLDYRLVEKLGTVMIGIPGRLLKNEWLGLDEGKVIEPYAVRPRRTMEGTKIFSKTNLIYLMPPIRLLDQRDHRITFDQPLYAAANSLANSANFLFPRTAGLCVI